MSLAQKRKKSKRKTRKEQENKRRRKPYARVRRYKITSALRLLARSHHEDEGIRRLQPQAFVSKLGYFYTGITSARLHQHALSLVPGARSLYTTGQRHYHNFCRLHVHPPRPADSAFLVECVAYLADVAMIISTSIKTYLSAVRSLHIDHGWPDTQQSAQVIRRACPCWFEACTRPASSPKTLTTVEPDPCAPHRIFWTAPWLSTTDKRMLKAECTLAFHGFL